VELRVQPVERRAKVFRFAASLVVLAGAQSCSPEVEAQHGKAKAVQRLHGVKHDLVVQRPTEQRMGMADQRGMRGASGAGVEQRLHAPGGTF